MTKLGRRKKGEGGGEERRKWEGGERKEKMRVGKG